MSKYILHNQDILLASNACMSFDNRSFLYGDGFFESIKVINSRCFNIESHYDRIINSSKILKIDWNVSLSNLENLLCSLIEKNNIIGGRLRLVVYRNPGGKYLPDRNDSSIIASVEQSENKFTLNKEGIRLGLFSEAYKEKNSFSNLKTTNSIIYVLASIFAQEHNFDDCVLLNSENNIIETSNSNLFLVKNNCIISPLSSDGCVDGVMREYVFDLLSERHEVVQRSINEHDLRSADEVFLTNSISGSLWVESYKDKKYSTSNIAHWINRSLNLRLSNF